MDLMLTFINPNFRHSLFHEHLFRYHVMSEHSLPDPGFTPYYDREFFELIHHYKTLGSCNISTMSLKEWYVLLLEDKVLMSAATDASPSVLLPVRSETLHPDTNWAQVWQIGRTKGLGPELTSFQFKMIHCLLPTQERVARIGLNEGNPGLCLHCRLDIETVPHSLIDCPRNMQVGLALLGCVQQVLPDLSAEAAGFRLCATRRRKLGCPVSADDRAEVHLGGKACQEGGHHVQNEGRG